MSTSTNRDSLLKLLTMLRPALSTQNYIPALQHFQFADGWITAFNDISSISAKCGVDLEGCVPGELLLRALGSFNADNVSLKEDGKGSNLVVSSGRSRLTLPTMPADKFPYEEPKGKVDSIDLTDGILEGIKRCLFSVGTDPTHPARMGITLDVDADKHAVLFSTDTFTISRYQTKDKIELPGDAPIILPTFFCEQLLTLGKNYPEDGIELMVYPGALVAKFGKLAYVMTRTMVDAEPLEFDKLIGRFVALGKLKSQLQAIPPGFDAAFGRAALVLSSEEDRATEVTVSKASIGLFSKSTMGESEDEVEWKGQELPKSFHIDPTLVTRSIKTCGSLAFYPKVMLVADDSAIFIHVITHSAA